MKCATVTAQARIGRPAPHAAPIAAVSHTTAAVVSPRTASPRTKMSPPPMKPMPETICAATREGSSVTCGPSTSLNPYLLTSTNSAAPVPTSACVLRPADFWRHSRSIPIREERPKASASSPTWVKPCPWGIAAASGAPAAPAVTRSLLPRGAPLPSRYDRRAGSRGRPVREDLRRGPVGRCALQIASGDEARDAAEQPPQRALGQAALQARAAVAAGEATGAERRAERPLGCDRSAVAQLQNLIGGDAGDRREERRGERRGRDLVDAVPERDQDRREQRAAADAVDAADDADDERERPHERAKSPRRARLASRDRPAAEQQPQAERQQHAGRDEREVARVRQPLHAH